MAQLKYFFLHLKYLFLNLWDLIRLGRFKTPREKLIDRVKKKYGVASVEIVPRKKLPKLSKKYRKTPRIYT